MVDAWLRGGQKDRQLSCVASPPVSLPCSPLTPLSSCIALSAQVFLVSCRSTERRDNGLEDPCPQPHHHWNMS